MNRTGWGAAIALSIAAGAYVGCVGGEENTTPSAKDAGAVDSSVPHDAAVGDAEEPATDDAGDAADAGSDAGWTPRSLTGLALWLEASQGISLDGGALAAWADQSGNGNDAILSDAGTPPKPIASALNGRPAVRFNGTSDFIQVNDAPSLQFGTGEFVVVVVAQHTTPTDGGPWGYGMFVSKQETAYPFVGPSLVANTEARTSAIVTQVQYPNIHVVSANVGYNDGSPLLLTMRRITEDAGADAGDAGVSTLNLRVNGADAGAATGAAYARDVSAVGRPVNVGGTPGAQDLAGDIAEIVAVKGPVSDADVLALETYMKAKYGL